MSEAEEGPGAALKSAREALGVTVREVADALNLPLHVVEAMEANDFDSLPQPVFARGYLRSYAKLLELDPNAVVAGMPKPSEEPAPAEPAAPPGGTVWIRQHPGVVLAAGAVVLVAVVVLLVLWLAPGDDSGNTGTATPESETTGLKKSSTQPAAPAAQTPRQTATPAPAADKKTAAADKKTTTDAEPTAATAGSVEPKPAAEAKAPDTAEAPGAEAPVVAAPAATEGASAPADEPSATPPDAATAVAVPVTPEGARRITADGDDLLELRFTDDCWVAVKEMDGKSLFSDLGRAGTTRLLVGHTPLRLRLGYAPGVSVVLNGEPVPIDRFTRNNVASLVVGE